MSYRKGITPLFSVLLLVGILVTAVGVFLFFFTDLISVISGRAGNETSGTITQIYEDFSIDAVDANRVYIRNKASVELKDLSFYVNGDIADVSPLIISPGDVGCFLLDRALLEGIVTIEVKGTVKTKSALKDYSGITSFYSSC